MIQHVITPDQKIVELQADPGLRMSRQPLRHQGLFGEVNSPMPQMDGIGPHIIESSLRNMIDEPIPGGFRQFEFQACMREFGYSRAASLNRHTENVNSFRFTVPVFAEIIRQE